MTNEQANGIITKLIGALPAQFIALIVVNIVIVGVFFYHMESQLDARENVLIELIKSCNH